MCGHKRWELRSQLEDSKGQARFNPLPEGPPRARCVQPRLEPLARPRPRTSDPNRLGLQPRVRSASAPALQQLSGVIQHRSQITTRN